MQAAVHPRAHQTDDPCENYDLDSLAAQAVQTQLDKRSEDFESKWKAKRINTEEKGIKSARRLNNKARNHSRERPRNRQSPPDTREFSEGNDKDKPNSTGNPEPEQ
jgi:hypothetical protein